MQAQRACSREAVQSEKGKRPLMCAAISGDKQALHEAYIGVELIWGTLAGGQVCPGATEIEVSLGDNPAEVGDERRVMPCIGVYALDRAGAEDVEGGAKGSNIRVRN